MAILADNEIRYSYIQYDDVDFSTTKSLIESGVFHIFLLAGKKWDIEVSQITEDFRDYVVFHEIPSYVTGSIHSANRANKSGMVL